MIQILKTSLLEKEASKSFVESTILVLNCRVPTYRKIQNKEFATRIVNIQYVILVFFFAQTTIYLDKKMYAIISLHPAKNK
jgi:hypothetical protein